MKIWLSHDFEENRGAIIALGASVPGTTDLELDLALDPENLNKVLDKFAEGNLFEIGGLPATMDAIVGTPQDLDVGFVISDDCSDPNKPILELYMMGHDAFTYPDWREKMIEKLSDKTLWRCSRSYGSEDIAWRFILTEWLVEEELDKKD